MTVFRVPAGAGEHAKREYLTDRSRWSSHIDDARIFSNPGHAKNALAFRELPDTHVYGVQRVRLVSTHFRDFEVYEP